MSRWKASGIHLLISFGVAVLFLSVMLLYWYPKVYFKASGADHLLTILISVDVVLGPLMTLIVFKAGKKHLKFDLSVIAIFQLGALLYGASVIWEARPVFVVFAVDRFTLVAANELNDKDLAGARFPQFRSLPWTGPHLVEAKRPVDPEERSKVLWSAVTLGKDIDRMPKYYKPYPIKAQGAIKHGRELSKLVDHAADKEKLVKDVLGHFKKGLDQVLYLPLVARKFDMAMLIDRATGQPLTAVPLNPWH